MKKEELQKNLQKTVKNLNVFEKQKRKKNKKKIYTIIGIVILLVALFTLCRGITYTNNRVDTLETQVKKIKDDILDLKVDMIMSRYEASTIDLTETKSQKINDDFIISVEKVESHLNGIKIVGTILNKSSIGHDNIEFNFKVAEQTKKLNIIEKISPGYSRKFELYIPDVPTDKSGEAEVSYISSILHYYEH